MSEFEEGLYEFDGFSFDLMKVPGRGDSMMIKDISDDFLQLIVMHLLIERQQDKADLQRWLTIAREYKGELDVAKGSKFPDDPNPVSVGLTQ